ncbi:MAG: UDP-N-acetylmuramate--L-alanine ligase [Microthrixaceae bacterium]|nr:UDP-N-acetylmuramate--L-alanine ligase [Microthrixaceae bacterium]
MVDETGVAVDLSRPRRIHLVGVGGAGVSAIAVILARLGHVVTGTDVVVTGAWPALNAAGVGVEAVGEADLFTTTEAMAADLVAHSTAFRPAPETVAELAAAGALVLDRAGILAGICALRPTVAVSGTHGKTSTTAMLATLLDEAGADPSFLVGAQPVTLDAAARWGGEAGLFVVEADESDGSFERLGAHTAVVTNVEEDHLDFWGSIEAIEAGFDRFLAQATVGVVCIDNPDGSGRVDPRAVELAARHDAVTVGECAGADWRIHSVQVERLTTSFGLTHGGIEVGPVEIGTPGRHHARNAAVAVAVAATHGIPVERAVAAVGRYRGVARRFEVVGEVDGITVVDDYAHNPGKIRALLASAQEAGWDRVVAVFQPHRYSRTEALGVEQGAAVAMADVVAVTDVYGAGETAVAGVTGLTVAHAALEARPGVTVGWTPGLDDALAWLRTTVRSGDLVLTIGAGDVHLLGPRLLTVLASPSPAPSTPDISGIGRGEVAGEGAVDTVDGNVDGDVGGNADGDVDDVVEPGDQGA